VSFRGIHRGKLNGDFAWIEVEDKAEVEAEDKIEPRVIRGAGALIKRFTRIEGIHLPFYHLPFPVYYLKSTDPDLPKKSG